MLSDLCERGHHPHCPHGSTVQVSGSVVQKIRRRLCACSCHSECALFDQSTAAEQDWMSNCSCAGAERWKQARRHGRWAGDPSDP